jgi:subtilisin family serine protease
VIEESTCISSTEICDNVDNDCDGEIDERKTCKLEVCSSFDCSKLSLQQLDFIDKTEIPNKFIIELKSLPVVEYMKKQEASLKTAPSVASLQVYTSQINSEQQAVRSELESRGLKIKKSFTKVFNGIAVEGNNLEGILDISNVKAIHIDGEVHTFLDESVPEIGATQVWNIQVNGTNLTGEGITIGIIDTGVDYTHPDLGGCFGAGCKVFGGWDFVNDDADPMDGMGHGTHVASIAAGKGVLDGVAPDAKIYAYRVLNNDGGGVFSDVIAAIENSVDLNQDGDFSDRLDIISMSLGAPGTPDDPTSIAVDNAVDAGVVVVSAVGNSGQDGYFTQGSPGVARKGIGVGASCMPEDVGNKGIEAYLIVRVQSSSSAYSYDPTVNIGTAGFLVDYQNVINPENFLNQDQDYAIFEDKNITKCPSGTNVIMNRLCSTCAYYCRIIMGFWGINTKSWAVVDLTNGSFPTAQYSNLDFTISNSDLGCDSSCNMAEGIAVFTTYKLDGKNTTWDLSRIVGSDNYSCYPNLEETKQCSFNAINPIDQYGLCNTNIAAFSSQGPTPIGTIKPDVVAPGHMICAAQYDDVIIEGSLPYSECIDDKHVWYSGTSMAAPHVAGAVALIKQAHPNWTPQEIKDTLKGTALDYDLSPLVQGSGRIDVLKAVQKTHPYPTAVLDSQELFVEGVVNIKGTAYSDSFLSYTLEYGEGINPSSWNLITTSTNPIQDNVLGTFDFDSISGKEIMLKLIVRDSFNQTAQNLLFLLKRDPSWKPGWPKAVEKDPILFKFSPVYSDLNRDGKTEIIAGSPSITGSKVYVWDVDGNLLSGWPKTVNIGGGSTPAIGDVAGDDNLEIVYMSTTLLSLEEGKTSIYVWDINGNLLPGWPKELTYSLLSLGSPMLEDIDEDGKDEIINSFGFDPIRIFKGNGTEIYGGWNSVFTYELETSGVSVGDLDNNGDKEIVALAGIENLLYVWSKNGTLLSGFPKLIPDPDSFSHSDIILVDLNKDNYKEMIFATFDHIFIYSYNGSLLGVLEFPLLEEGFSEIGVPNTPYLLDVDNNGFLEILMDREIGYIEDHKLKIRASDIFLFNNTDIFPVFNSTPENWQNNYVGQKNEFGINDVYFINSIKEIVKINPRFSSSDIDKKRIFDYVILNNLSFEPSFDGSAIGDIDGDHKLEIIFILSSGSPFIHNTQVNVGTYVFVVDLEENIGGVSWPMYKTNQKHTGCYDCDKPQYLCADITNDGRVSAPDIIAIVNYVFKGGTINVPAWVADVNGNGEVTAADILYLVRYIYKAGPAPACNPSTSTTTQTTYTQAELQYYETELAKAGITVDITPDTTTTKTTPKVSSFD